MNKSKEEEPVGGRREGYEAAMSLGMLASPGPAAEHCTGLSKGCVPAENKVASASHRHFNGLSSQKVR